MGDGADTGAERHGDPPGSDETSEPTGRYIVVLSEQVAGDPGASASALASMAGVSSVASSREFKDGAVDLEQTSSSDATLFAELGVAVVTVDPSRRGAMAALATEDPRILAVEPERVQRALEEQPASPEYVRGFRDGVSSLHGRVADAAAELGAPPSFADSVQFTWGLAATRAASSSRTGANIAVAILDSGLDRGHPDFAGRPIVARSFVPGQPVQDGGGHGTHTVGTSCGPADPPGPSRRYGVATEAKIFVGKVLSNRGFGADGQILAGINWALANKVHVISMSLGIDFNQVSQAYEAVGQRALAAGTLIVAAAGNNADRAAGYMGFVGIPANSPSILAVAAVDANLRIANFSPRSSAGTGGRIDIAAPGVAIYSSWPMPDRYHITSGTSMAAPHVAGIAALLSQATGARGAELWSKLTEGAQPLNLPSVDVGAGLVQAPS